MFRRDLVKTSVATALVGSIPSWVLAQSDNKATASKKDSDSQNTYDRDEILIAGSNFLGITVEAIGGAMEKIFAEYGDRPTAYIAGEEASGALGIGVRYGKGNLYMKSEPDPLKIFWQGPSVGFDGGGNASRVFTLAYNLLESKDIYRRYPGIEGSAYYIGGVGVNYQRAEGIVLTPIRAGIGFRLGANLGYLSYTKKRHYLPL
jgi:hypothetical protein